MNFLKKYGITEEIIEKIKTKNDPSQITMLLHNEEEVEEIIEYFQKIGITVVDELLISRLDIFFHEVEAIKNEFNKYNIEVLVNLINEDINAINFI